MKKIISLFVRDFTDHAATAKNEVTPGAEWVIAGEGVATRKRDGTAIMVRESRLFKRYDCKKGKIAPPGFELCCDADPVTGHWPGWVECKRDNPADKWAWEAFDLGVFSNGTYELCGPKVQGNPEKWNKHILIRHSIETMKNFPRDFEGIKSALESGEIEGVVWHHPDGRMVKITTADFWCGKWPRREKS